MGKFRKAHNEHGLGLLRVNEVMGQAGKGLVVKDEKGQEVGRAHTWIPHWWPRESDPIVRKVLEQSQKEVQQKG